jgi:cell shape-determining protein MreC
MDSQPKPITLYVSALLAAIILFLCDQLGFLGWYKDIRSFIELPFLSASQYTRSFTGFSISSLWNNTSLQEENDNLKGRILELQKEIDDQNLELANYKGLADLKQTLGLLAYKQTIIAYILDTSVNHIPGRILLNKGSADGLATGMVVTYKDYYVGYISTTNTHTAECDSIFFPGQSFIGYIIPRKVSGTLSTNISDITLTDILATETIKPADIVSIRKDGYSYDFPVGVVTTVSGVTGSAERTAEINPFVSLETISFVTVVKQ